MFKAVIYVQSSFDSFLPEVLPSPSMSHLPWFCVWAKSWLSWVVLLILFAEMFKLYISDCAKPPWKYRIVIASVRDLLFFLWSRQYAVHQVHVTRRTELLFLYAWLFLSLMKWDFPVSSGDEKDVLDSDPLDRRATSWLGSVLKVDLPLGWNMNAKILPI